MLRFCNFNFLNYSSSMYVSLSMVGKTKALRTVKERTSGREDLGVEVDIEISPSSMSSFFEEADSEEQHPPTVGQIVTGTVIEMDDNGALLEMGGKMSGYLPVKEAALIAIKHVNQVFINAIAVYVVKDILNSEHLFKGSRNWSRSHSGGDWHLERHAGYLSAQCAAGRGMGRNSEN